VASLPTADDGTWVVPNETLAAAGLQDDVQAARRFIIKFALWARDAISRLPPAPAAEYEATDFNDYYKLVMSRVQLIYTQASARRQIGDVGPLPLACFQTQLRRRPQFKKNGEDSCSTVFDESSSRTPKAGVADVGSFESSRAAFRTALAAVGARRFSAATLRQLISERSPKAAAIEESLSPANEAWIKALDGRPLFRLLDEDADFSCGEDVEVKLVTEGGIATMLAQGPWFRVTFCETPLLQCMSQFFTDTICTEGDDGCEAWCREALMNFATTSHQVVRMCPHDSFSLFSGRRAPNPDFHLLQHMYLAEQLGGMATSSLFAGRVLGGASMPQQLIGTLAHEGPMGFMCLHSELDGSVPLSSLLWHLLFWSTTSNHTILPDGHGSAVFKAMLDDLGLADDVAMARQDSGRLPRFAQIFSRTKKMASEIEVFGDVTEAMALGYVGFGAGGFFGEKRRVAGPEFSLAAKLTKAIYTDASGDRVVGFAAKLGDCSENGAGSWAEHDVHAKLPTKFIVSSETDRAAMFRKMLDYGARGDAWFDATSAGGGPPEHLVRKGEALRLVGTMREIASSPTLTPAPFAPMVERLTRFAERIEAAAATLDG